MTNFNQHTVTDLWKVSTSQNGFADAAILRQPLAKDNITLKWYRVMMT